MPFTEEEKRERKNARQREYARRTGYEANNKYNKAHTRSITIRFGLETDADILERLDAIENKSGYIKELIRRDMARENGVDS